MLDTEVHISLGEGTQSVETLYRQAGRGVKKR